MYFALLFNINAVSDAFGFCYPSDRKKSVMLRMVGLYSFVKILEEDWNAVMRGISIEYVSLSKNQEDVGVSMGWSKK
jgi:hypothetical protein